MKAVRVISPGLLTTVQDLGRTGFLQYGVPEAGAMDRLSLMLANLLAGNALGDAALEITMSGPVLEFLNPTAFSITGADISPKLNGVSIKGYRRVYAAKGDILEFGRLISGARAYVAFHGGLDVPLVMKSRSTYLRGWFGGVEGRSLRSGDELTVRAETLSYFGVREIPEDLIPKYKDGYTARVIMGPEERRFTEAAIENFLKSTYSVTNQWDRMGIRLKGAPIEHREGADILSAGITLGTIQVPSSGDPIVLLADRQTTGGYTRIANIVSVDIPYVAQLKPGDSLSFEEISIEEAQDLVRKQQNLISGLKKAFEVPSEILKGELRTFSIGLGKKRYNLLLQEIE